jgi:uncharacterized protein
MEIIKIPALILALLCEFWHRWISVWLPSACRYEPVCSIYMSQALKKYGVFKGGFMGLKRLARCHPWSSHGLDPVD